MNPVELVDGVVADRVLVFGSVPPNARDLDLLVRPPEHEAIAAALRRQGFVNRRMQWVRFRDCSAQSVDVVPASSWRLPAAETHALFTEAEVVHGTRNLVSPAPHHVLLIMARRVARDGRLDAKRRKRVDEAVARDAAAWSRARERADEWQARRALALLEEAWRTGAPVRAIERVRAEAERLASGERHGPLERLRAWRGLGRSRKGFVVAFSGLDGSGKTWQAEALRRNLESVGFDATVAWTRLSYNPSLDLVAFPIKSTLRLLRASTPKSRRHKEPSTEDGQNDPGKALRRRSALVTHVWATVVSLANASSHRRATLRHLRMGKAVICDRYVLDSTVHLRYRYGEGTRFAVQAWLLRVLSPRPLRAYFLDVPAEVALHRKAEQYGLEQLHVQARLYRETYEAIDARRLDGETARDDLCTDIALDVWTAAGRVR